MRTQLISLLKRAKAGIAGAEELGRTARIGIEASYAGLKIQVIEAFLSSIFIKNSNTPREFLGKLLKIDTGLIGPATGNWDSIFESISIFAVIPDAASQKSEYLSDEKRLKIFASTKVKGISVFIDIQLSGRFERLKPGAGDKFCLFLRDKLERAATRWFDEELATLPIEKDYSNNK